MPSASPTVQIRCTACRTLISVPAVANGQRFQCPKCLHAIVRDEASAAPVQAPQCLGATVPDGSGGLDLTATQRSRALEEDVQRLQAELGEVRERLAAATSTLREAAQTIARMVSLEQHACELAQRHLEAILQNLALEREIARLKEAAAAGRH